MVRVVVGRVELKLTWRLASGDVVSVLEHSQRNVIISTQLLEGFDINEFMDRHRPRSLESGWLSRTWQTVMYYLIY